MSDLGSLTLLLELHERDRDDAKATHEAARAASEAAAAQADQLRQYRQDYERRWSTRFETDNRIDLWRCYQGFSERLSGAIAQQTDIADHAAGRLEHTFAALRVAEQRCASVRRLIERRVAESRREAERRDQKQTDEFAARAAWSRGAASRPFS